MAEQWRAELFGYLDPEEFYDFQVTRPTVRLEGGVSRVIEYKLMSGPHGASPFWQMLQHVVNNGSYHRGQVTTMLRQLGADPPKSQDLIAFYRERDQRKQ